MKKVILFFVLVNFAISLSNCNSSSSAESFSPTQLDKDSVVSYHYTQLNKDRARYNIPTLQHDSRVDRAMQHVYETWISKDYIYSTTSFNQAVKFELEKELGKSVGFTWFNTYGHVYGNRNDFLTKWGESSYIDWSRTTSFNVAYDKSYNLFGGYCGTTGSPEEVYQVYAIVKY